MKQENVVNQLLDTRKPKDQERKDISLDQRDFLLKRVNHAAKLKLARNELLQKSAAFRQSLESSSEESKIENLEKYFLKGFLSYTSRLYKTGEISESAYVSLITQATEFYAEYLVELEVTKALDKYKLYLEKLGI